MLVSFIIPAHNEEQLLPLTLGAIHAAAKALALEYEIIVADDASTDRTAEIARENGALVVSHQRRQIAATRNLGARAARGEVLFFIDADTRPPAGSVREALAALREGAIGGGGPVAFDGPVPLYARLLLSPLNLAFRLAKLAGGCFVFCTRDVFDKSGGFDETIYASEEINFCNALKRHGRFVIVRTKVITSGRKIRTFSPFEILGVIVRGGFNKERLIRDRSKLDIWYGPRREDPWAAEKQ